MDAGNSEAPAAASPVYPFWIAAEVVGGHQRGKEMGFPTANMALKAATPGEGGGGGGERGGEGGAVGGNDAGDGGGAAVLDPSLGDGVYYGWSSINATDVAGTALPSVLSIGTNPTFDGLARTLEVHVLHEFDEDFYGAEMRLAIVGYLRPMVKFDGMDELIAAIENDKNTAAQLLAAVPSDDPIRSHPWFAGGDEAPPVPAAIDA